MSFLDLSLTLFLAELIGIADVFCGAAPIAGEKKNSTPIKVGTELFLILLLFLTSLTPARSIPGRTYPVRMSSLKYQVPSPPIPTKFPLKSPRGANLATRVWPARNNNSAKALCLLVHGAGTHSGYFDSLATHLTQHDIFCASYDQVNCGYSDPEPDAPSPGVTHVRNFDCFMEDVCAAIEWMQMEAGTTSAPVFLFGESFGSLQVRCRAYILSQVTLPGGVATKPCLSFDSQCMRCPFWTPVRR